jgi:GH24 family phage-related lysozyme (muramidase)
MKIPRKAIASLTLSAAALFSWVLEEHYTNNAVIPTKGDRPTLGFGSTFHEDGRPVKLGDTTTPVRALMKMKAHIDKEESSFVRSLPGVELHQGEYDIYMGFVYQYGTGNWWKSSMRTRLLASDYKGACDALLAYRFAAGYDCSTMINGNPNKRCWGVWTRQQKRHADCVALQ